MPNEIITERFKLLIPEYREYLLSGAPAEIASTFAEPHKLAEERAVSLENGFAMYLLFFLNIDGLSDYILQECGLTQEESTLLANGMYNALPENVRQLISNTEIKVLDTPQEEGILELESDINEVEAVLKSPALNPIRTMGSDSRQVGYSSNEETTYTSTQPSLADESK